MTPRPGVVTLGEVLLRLTPSGVAPLRAAREVEVHVGGSEANVAAGLASLGHPAAWLSCVSDAPPGDLILGELARRKVDTRFVARHPARTGTYYLETGVGVRPSRATYDREHSAFTHLAPDDVPDAAFDGAAAFHTTGISLSVKDAPAAAVRHAWDRAGAHGALRSFDVNLRRALVTPAELGERSAPYLAACDLAFLAERDARAVWNRGEAPFETVVDAAREAAPGALLVFTRGEGGACAIEPDGTRHDRAAVPTAGPGRIGRGDAFAAGFLARYLETRAAGRADAGDALAWGVAAASFKATLPGDLADLDRTALSELAAGTSGGDVRR